MLAMMKQEEKWQEQVLQNHLLTWNYCHITLLTLHHLNQIFLHLHMFLVWTMESCYNTNYLALQTNKTSVIPTHTSEVFKGHNTIFYYSSNSRHLVIYLKI